MAHIQTHHRTALDPRICEIIICRVALMNRALAYGLSAASVFGLGFYAAFQI
ncbi:hypothetical protein AAIH46_18045 [Rhizobium sp. 0TCS1.26]|uniref:hypothetical protein n=1 Tax=Rhizobium sp. 0TCS1.26 TaxID=3142623 RepID=UPI003D2BF841